MDRRPDSDALRSVVRDVLRDLIPAARGPAGAADAQEPAARTTPEPGAPKVEDVALANDADLAAFVQRLLRLFSDAPAREAIRTGRHRFRLARGAAPDSHSGRTRADGTGRIDKGVLSESKVLALARAGNRIVLGTRVVVTPLAKDKARQLGVKLERET